MSLFSALYDPVMRWPERACLGAWRAELLANANGEVLEIGAGTGANLGHYPVGPASHGTITHLELTEPDPAMLARLHAKLPVSAVPSAHATAASADALPFDAGRFDTAVATLVLCSVPDLQATLAELRRVLKPGGRLLFLEHVAADDRPDRLAWQRRLEPAWKILAAGCHLTRRTGEAIRDAGFVAETETRASMRKAPPWVRPTLRGVARRA